MSERIKRLMQEAEPRKIKLERLTLWKEANVRKTDAILDTRELSENIQTLGLQTPLIVKQPEKENGNYLVISGQRRLYACKLVNYSPVPCLILKDVTLYEAQLISLSENLYRKEMTEDDLSSAVAELYSHYEKVSIVASMLGVSEYSVNKYLKYNVVPRSVKEYVRPNGISQSQAIKIYQKFSDEGKQVIVARELASIKDRLPKTAFYQSIKKARPDDDMEQIRKRAKRFEGMVRYEVLIPEETSDVVKETSLKTGIDVEEILSTIIENWVDLRIEKRLPLIESE